MGRKTYIANQLSTAQLKAQYDSEAKKIVADKGILARIIKEIVVEMKEYSLEEIEGAIEGVEISEVPIYPGKAVQRPLKQEKKSEDRKPQAIIGLATEDKVPNEGVFNLAMPEFSNRCCRQYGKIRNQAGSNYGQKWQRKETDKPQI